MSIGIDPEKKRTTAPESPGPLVDPSWLMEWLEHPGLGVIDLRDPEEYARGHIPGAMRLDLSTLGARIDGCDSVLVAAADFSALMSELGISNDHMIVAYDDQWGLAASRLLWALHYYGHAKAAVLDGGWDRWEEEAGPVASGDELPAPGRFEAALRPDVHADTEWIVRRLGAVVLLDTRTTAEFEEGHLPGAISWDWFNAVPAGSWNVSRDPEELRIEWQGLGLDPSDEVVVYCGSGMRAAHTYLVLRNAGFDRVRLYDGSWQAWSVTMGGADDD